MAIYIYWFLLALILVGLEMATGTFYLLVISIAMFVGGAAAWLGFGLIVQLILAALTGISGTIVLRHWKARHGNETSSQSLDAGQTVKVLTWRDDGSARVFYRGAEWDAEPEAANTPRDVQLYIKAMRGSVIVVTHIKPI